MTQEPGFYVRARLHCGALAFHYVYPSVGDSLAAYGRAVDVESPASALYASVERGQVMPDGTRLAIHSRHCARLSDSELLKALEA